MAAGWPWLPGPCLGSSAGSAEVSSVRTPWVGWHATHATRALPALLVAEFSDLPPFLHVLALVGDHRQIFWLTEVRLLFRMYDFGSVDL